MGGGGDFGDGLSGDAGHEGSHHHDQGHQDNGQHTGGGHEPGQHHVPPHQQMNGAHIPPTSIDPELLGDSLSQEQRDMLSQESRAARQARAAQPAVTAADIGAAKDGLGDRIKREIDRTRDVITKGVDSAAAKAEDAGKTVAAATEKTKGWMSRMLSTTKGKVITFAGVPTLLIGGVMTYNHFKNKGEDGPSR